MPETIPDQEWNKWIETGKASQKRLHSIALRIRLGHVLDTREQALYIYHAQEIEALLKSL